MNTLLSLTTHLLNIVSFEEAPKATVGEAALYALIGFLVVFVGISLLISVVWLVGKVMGAGQGAAKEETPKANVPQKAPIAKAVIGEDEVDEETLAVITAAIMAYYEQQNSRCEFTVKRIKRMNRY